MERSRWVFMKQFATRTAVPKTPRPITFELAPPFFFCCGGCCCCMQNVLHFVFVSTKEGEEPSFLFVALPYRPASGDLDKTQAFEVLVTHDCCHSVLINLIVLYKTIQLTGSNHSFWQGLLGVLGHWWQAQELDWCTAFFLVGRLSRLSIGLL